jgi:predicted nucleic acid-binding protein
LKKLILDTSVCIDLHNGKLLDIVLQLPYKYVLPDVMISELLEPAGEMLLTIGFFKEGTSGEETQTIYALRNKYIEPSFNDLLSLLLAKKNACCLITGDNALRKAASKEGVATHGLLWLLDEMVLCGILSGPKAANALRIIIAEGSWLPKNECENRFKKWRK